MVNTRSDISAKEAYRQHLLSEGYESVKIVRSPVDIIAQKHDIDHFFEIKYTSKEKNYFGAATLTEWQAAMEHSDRFWFVIASKRDDAWVFNKYTPKEFMRFSYIPPFKVYFNIPVCIKESVETKARKTAVEMTSQRLKAMINLYDRFRDKNI